MKNSILIIEGEGYGSEGKGDVAAKFCQWYKIDYSIRKTSTKKGNTVFYKNKPYSLQYMPTGWGNGDTKLVIIGDTVNPVILEEEINIVSNALKQDIRPRLFVDKNSIDPKAVLTLNVQTIDAQELLNNEYEKDKQILFNGNNANILSPSLNYEVALVVRVFPISNKPFPYEFIAWDTIVEEINNERVRFGMAPIVNTRSLVKFKRTKDMLSMNEYDTNELKRIFEFDSEGNLYYISRLNFNNLNRSIKIHRPKYLILTFMNYLFPTIWNMSVWKDIILSPRGQSVKDFITEVERRTNTPVGFINTAPNNLIKVRQVK